MTKEQFMEKSQEVLGGQAAVIGDGLFRVFDEDGRYIFESLMLCESGFCCKTGLKL